VAPLDNSPPRLVEEGTVADRRLQDVEEIGRHRGRLQRDFSPDDPAARGSSPAVFLPR